MTTCDYKEMEEVGFLPIPENIEEAKQALSNGDSDVGLAPVDVFLKFTQIFHNHVEYVQEWFPCGQNKIRIQFKDGSQKVFTYANDITWNYESLDSFIERMAK